MMSFADAIDDALTYAMSKDDRIVVFGEDVHTLRLNLLARFGGRRVRAAPISEAAFVGASVGAATAGLQPVVEVMLVSMSRASGVGQHIFRGLLQWYRQIQQTQGD